MQLLSAMYVGGLGGTATEPARGKFCASRKLEPKARLLKLGKTRKEACHFYGGRSSSVCPKEGEARRNQ